MSQTSTTPVDLGAVGRAKMSPRKRAKITRGIQYAILVAVLVFIVAVTDWARVGESFFNPATAADMVGRLPGAILNTLVYMLASFVVGLALGVVLALMKLSSVRVYRAVASVYIEFFRGIPAILVVLTVGFAVPIAFGISFNSVTTKIATALGLVSAAYIAETLRAGIQAVPKGQIEAARSLGMSYSKTMRKVVLPQAFRIVLPPMTNEIVLLTKDTSFVFLLGLQIPEYELTKLGQDFLNSATGGITAMFVVGSGYLVITIPLGYLARWLERTMGDRSRP